MSHRYLPGRAYLAAVDELRENRGQWAAFESTGNCVVLAGPGSGKTRTLTTKVARLLAEDVRPPRRVACLTFSTECVRELTRRLARLGVRDTHNVVVTTVHGFCLGHIVTPFADVYGVRLPRPITVGTDVQIRRSFEQAVHDVLGPRVHPREAEPPFNRLRRTITDRRSSAWNTENAQVRGLVRNFERALLRQGCIDFDGLALLAVKIVQDSEWIRRALQARFPVLVVDEYQDLGAPLHELVDVLCAPGGSRLLAVGDPDQSIYGFLNAKPRLLEELATRPDVEPVRLRFNYRSGSTIVRAAAAALGEDRQYVARSGHAGTVDFHECDRGLEHQAETICGTIIPQALARLPQSRLGDVAVIYPTQAEGDVLAGVATAYGLNHHRVDRGGPYRKTPFTRWLEECAAWCAGGWLRARPSLRALTRSWIGLLHPAPAPDERHRHAVALARCLYGLREADRSLRDWLACLETEFLDGRLPRHGRHAEEWTELAKIHAAAMPGGRLEEHAVVTFGGQGGSPDHLTLVTLHSAKGLEFDVVVLVGIDDGAVPHVNDRTLEQQQEARRKFYVGLTRARHEVHLTYSGYVHLWTGERYANGPSPFLSEVRARLLEPTPDLPVRADAASYPMPVDITQSSTR